MRDDYIFESEQLGFRSWRDNDKALLHKLNSDPKVMEFFPYVPNYEETCQFVTRMQEQFKKSAFCYFAVDILSTGEFIGFIGLSEQNYEAPFTPCIDIGWRISQNYWHQGYATEGGMRCLKYGFDEIGLNQIWSAAPTVNEKSINVMKKLGMEFIGHFEHPKLLLNERLKKCAYYKIEKTVS